jgi:hypothetical protein
MGLKHAKITVWLLATTVTLAVLGSAGRSATAQAEQSGTLVTVKARVTAINMKERLVTLRGPQGNELVIEAGPEVQNLSQVKVGDDVAVRYYDALAVELQKSENPELGLAESTTTERAAAGQRPGGTAGRQVKGNLKVVLINLRDNSVTLQGKPGQVRWVKVRDPQMQAFLRQIKNGDIVSITYQEALALSVEPVKG